MRFVLSLWLLCGTVSLFAAPAGELASAAGLIARVESGGRVDTMLLPQLALYVAAGDSPTLFVPAGAFELKARGTVSVEARAQYTFSTRLNGKLELWINGNPALSALGSGETSAAGKAVRLNKGTNSVEVRYTAPAEGPAFFRIFWASKEAPYPAPVPATALQHDPAEPLAVASVRKRDAMALIRSHRCAHCHAAGGNASADAPDFKEIGSRLREEWMAAWIADPAHNRQGTHMPVIFSGPDREQKARASAAYLASLRTASSTGASLSGSKEAGRKLFGALHCEACHGSGSEHGSLERLDLKFQPGALEEYLRKPQAHFARNPMPDFHLTPQEASDLAAFLLDRGAYRPVEAANAKPTPNKSQVEVGRKIIQEAGCLNCHALDFENRFHAPSWAELRAGLGAKGNSDGGCLSSEPSTNAPYFNFSAAERASLLEFLAMPSEETETHHAPHEIARLEVRELGCANCHEQVEGLPRLALAGAKLRPEWMEQFIGGHLAGKPRPWLEARMPAFPAQAADLARGLAAQHGLAPQTEAEAAPSTEMVSTGAKLVSASGGFSCVACHSIGSGAPPATLESPGINFSLSGKRLQADFFHRWVLNPVLIEPATKMPVFFDPQGHSQLVEFFEGDGHRQIEAMREFVRSLPSRAPLPTP